MNVIFNCFWDAYKAARKLIFKRKSPILWNAMLPGKSENSYQCPNQNWKHIWSDICWCFSDFDLIARTGVPSMIYHTRWGGWSEVWQHPVHCRWYFASSYLNSQKSGELSGDEDDLRGDGVHWRSLSPISDFSLESNLFLLLPCQRIRYWSSRSSCIMMMMNIFFFEFCP